MLYSKKASILSIFKALLYSNIVFYTTFDTNLQNQLVKTAAISQRKHLQTSEYK